jgi:hypothetical protein
LVKAQVATVELMPIKPAKVGQVVLMPLVVVETTEEDKPVARVILLQAEPFVLYGDSTVHSLQLTLVIYKINNFFQKALRSLFC